MPEYFFATLLQKILQKFTYQKFYAIIYYTILRGLVQIMNFEKLGKSLKWFFTSSTIIEKFPDMVLFMDSDGVITDLNRKAQNYFQLSGNITINEVLYDGMKTIRDAVKTKKAVLTKTKYPEDGKFIEVTATKIDRNYCISIRHATPQTSDENAKTDIEKFNNEKNGMIVKLENEIKSPLNSITGFSQGLVDGIAGELSEKQSKYLKIIHSNAGDLSEFLYKFIDFSYAESILYEPEVKKFDIISEIRAISKNIKHDEEKIKIELNYENIENRWVNTDYKAIKSIFENILETSIQTMEKGRTEILFGYPDDEDFITYGLDDNKSYLKIIVSDNGNGFAPDEIEHICNPYNQTNQNHKNFVRSLKLGIAGIMIQRLQGNFNINSDIKKGSIYNIIIPIEREENE